jgi:hypothetical protein
MNFSGLQIDQLNLKVPGLTRAQARLLGHSVAARLVDLNVGMEPRGVDSLTLRVRGDVSSVERLAEQIAAEVWRSLK